MIDYECTEENFLADIANHTMKVVRDDGNFRNLVFSNNGSSIYRFNITTWDGYLAITGDMGCIVLSRLQDMFEFFRTDAKYNNPDNKLKINPSYWGEKIVSGREQTKEFSVDKLKKLINEYIDSSLDGEDWTNEEIEELKDDIESDINYFDTNSIRLFDLINEYSYYKNKEYLSGDKPDFEFTDWWDYHSMAEVYTNQYIWQCYAISYAVREYDKYKGELNEND